MNAPEGDAVDVGVLSVVLVKTVGSTCGVELGDSVVLDGGMLDSITVADSAVVLVASICDETPGKMISVSDIVMGVPEFEASTALVGRPLVMGPSVVLGASVGRPLVTGISVVLVASVGEGTPENNVSVSEIVMGAPRSVVVDVGVGKPSVRVVDVPFGISVAVVIGCSLGETGDWVDSESAIWPVKVSVVVPVGAAVARGSFTIDDEAARESAEDVSDAASPRLSTLVEVGVSDTAEPPVTRYKA